MRADELRAAVISRGGDPDCLHCRMAVLISLHFEEQADRPCVGDVAGALAEVIGDLVRRLAPEDRARGLAAVVHLMTVKAGVAGDGAPPPMPLKLLN